MQVALGFKAHSGWAALVALGERDGELVVAERRRVELVDAADAHWTKQPYHAAEGLEPDEARDVVQGGVEAAQRIARTELRAAAERLTASDQSVSRGAVLVGAGMPEWTVDEILSVHFRMHKAEGELFREALVRAVEACGLLLTRIPEKGLESFAGTALGMPAARLAEKLSALGRTVGPPWGKDQKEAALAAWVALRA